MSITVHVTVVVPIGYTAGALLLTDATAQLSPVTGMPSCTLVAVALFRSVGTATATGAVITGFSVSITVTVNVAVDVPTAFVAVAVMV